MVRMELGKDRQRMVVTRAKPDRPSADDLK